ncbi:hypothetical protein HRbin15_02475 [bacterium HR15]|nr:hypothetical protein HRbin15_02475 [bacterium HR15]
MRAVKVIIWARDPIIEAFLREQIRTLRSLEVVEQGVPEAQGAIIDAHLLSFSERRVLSAFLRHDRVKQVAEALFITPDTVRKHLKRIYRKLGVSSLHRALLRAKELGLLMDEGWVSVPL